MKRKIAHIVPSMNIGGVEIGIKKSYVDINQEFDYRVFYVKRRGSLDVCQKHVFSLFWLWCKGDWRPDIVITSLWWSHLIGCIVKVLGVKWVAFFHSPRFSHALDKCFISIAWFMADHRLVDSGATDSSMQGMGKKKSHTIPYLFQSNYEKDVWKDRPIDFIWVGRTTPVKRLDILEKFLISVQQTRPQAQTILVLAGAVPKFFENFLKTTTLKIHVRTNIENRFVRELLSRSKFYTLFSDYEGMSMSTVEAVQAGCVVLTRPVGEIPSYLKEKSAIWITDISRTGIHAVAKESLNMIACDMSVNKIRENAFSDLSNNRNYPESMKMFLKLICKD